MENDNIYQPTVQNEAMQISISMHCCGGSDSTVMIAKGSI